MFKLKRCKKMRECIVNADLSAKKLVARYTRCEKSIN